MKIAQVGAYPLSGDCIHGGVESSVWGLVKELGRGHEVCVYDVPRIGAVDKVESGMVTVRRYANPGAHNNDMLSRLDDIRRDIEEFRPDIVHLHGTSGLNYRLYLLLTESGIPCVVTVHGLAAVEKRKALRRSLSLKKALKFLKAVYQYYRQSRTEYRFIGKMDTAIVDTEYVADALKKYPVRRLPSLRVIPQGIDGRFSSLRCDAESDVILSVGSISPRKGHLLLVDAFNGACAQGLKARLRIVGVVSDSEYYAQLKDKIGHSPYSSRIELMANASGEELDAAYRGAKLFALHTQEESQGIVFAEAMATGLPVVATNVGGVPYVVRDGLDGLLCDYGDAASFASNLKTLMSDRHLWERFSASARQRALDYDWKTIADRIVGLYEEKIHKR